MGYHAVSAMLLLNTDETFALSQSDGREPSSSNLENMTCMFGAIVRQSFCNRSGFMWSGPCALSGFRPCFSLKGDFGVNSN